MNTGFACPTCLVPLVLTCTATAVEDLTTDVAARACPNPFCRTELPPRRGNLSLDYALVGTVAVEIRNAFRRLS